MKKIAFLLLIVPYFIFAQKPKEEIYLTEIFERAIELDGNGEVVIFGKIIRVDNLNKVDNTLEDYLKSKIKSLTLRNDKIVIPTNIRIINCELVGSAMITNFIFDEFEISNCYQPGTAERISQSRPGLFDVLTFYNIGSSEFNKLVIRENELGDLWGVIKSVVNHELQLFLNKSTGWIQLHGNNFLGDVILQDNLAPRIEISDNTFSPNINFDADSIPEDVILEKGLSIMNFFKQEYEYSLYLNNNKFINENNIETLIYIDGNFRELEVVGNDFNVNVSVNGRVNNLLHFNKNHFNRTISFTNFSFSELRNEIDWIPISENRLASYLPLDELEDEIEYYRIFQGSREEADTASTLDYKNLLSSYKSLHSIFLRRGDIDSANGLYVEMKNKETVDLINQGLA